ncbi:MAG: OmpA family protein [Alphaproteobacteria bacterium]|nr:OmpA family protein [Alphaproteobacteria bacterium]
MKTRYLLGASAALAVAFSCAHANAQFGWLGGPYPVTFYVGPEGGWTSLANQKDTITTPPFRADIAPPGFVPPNGPFFSSFNGSARYNSGFNAGARLGLQYGPLRVEEEYSYRHNGLSSFGAFFGPNINTAFSGNRNTNSIMTNFIYDFTVGWPVSPHIGFGVGAVNNVDSVSLGTVGTGLTANQLVVSGPGGVLGRIGAGTPFTNPVLGGTFLKGNSWNFGYQAIAGIRYDINPLLAFDLDYRYMASTQPSFNNKGVAPFPPFGFSGLKYTSGYNTQNIVASLTMKFGAPPAPPPPAPPAPPPPPTHQVFLVFFDWDKYNITPEGQQIIVLAANQYKAGGRVQIRVDGYTDTTGSFGYNQRLSERRANAVAAALERLGVPRSDMVVAGHSFNDLRVPTPPGVREPQNRRVEITFP